MNTLTFASIRLLAQCRLPWQIVVKVFAVFTVKAFRVVRAFASTVHHVVLRVESFQRQTTRSVSIARARSAHNHVGDGVIIFLLDLRTIVE